MFSEELLEDNNIPTLKRRLSKKRQPFIKKIWRGIETLSKQVSSGFKKKFGLKKIAEKQGSPALANGITAAGVAILLAGLVYVGMNIIFEYCNLYTIRTSGTNM